MTSLAAALDPTIFGGKAAALARALGAGFPVPTGIVIESKIAEAIVHDPVSRYSEEIQAEMDALGLPGPTWAVRSSAIDEDGSSASFAGLHLTQLNVHTAGVIQAITTVVASASDPAALAYRDRLQIEGSTRMAVIVQQMVDAHVAGVLFTRNPVTGARERYIEASWGYGESVVSGLVTPDTFRLALDGTILEASQGIKDTAIVPDTDGGTKQVSITHPQDEVLCLTEDQIGALGSLASAIEAAFSGDHDIEWAFTANSAAPLLLQQRPITRIQHQI